MLIGQTISLSSQFFPTLMMHLVKTNALKSIRTRRTTIKRVKANIGRRPSHGSEAILNFASSIHFGESLRAAYAQAVPFPHLVIDNAARAMDLEKCSSAFPPPEDPRWFNYPDSERNQRNKQVMWDMDEIPRPVKRVIHEMLSRRFVRFVETISGIPSLIPDHTLYGGGLHQTGRLGRLDVHVDHDFNPVMKLYRRVTALLYLSHWKPHWGGSLELWEGERSIRGERLIMRRRSLEPNFNRLVIFTNSEDSYHGYPKPITCPSDVTRKSLAVYYLSVEPHPSYCTDSHHKARFLPCPAKSELRLGRLPTARVS